MPTWKVRTTDEIFTVEAPTEQAANFIVEGELDRRDAAASEAQTGAADIMKSFGEGDEAANQAAIQQQRDRREADALPAWKRTALGLYDTGNLVAKGAADTVGLSLDKAAAWTRSGFDSDSPEYAEELAKQKRLTEAAQNRVGPVADVLAEGTGGLMTGLGIAGKIGSLPGLARGATGLTGAATRTALAGAENFGFGAANAFANDEDVLTGGAIGAGAGGATSLAGKTLLAGGRGVARFAEPFFRPSQAGVKRTGEALAADLAAGHGYSDDFMRHMQDQGVPLLNVDVGGPATRRLAGAAARGSDEASNLAVAADRTLGQGGRIKGAFDRSVGFDVENTNLIERLDNLSRNSRRPLYDRAYANPNGQALWDADFQNFTKHPEVRQAIREADDAAARDAAENGTPVIQNPFVENPDGSLGMRSGASPSLPFWDIVQRRLGGLAQKAHATPGEGDIGRSVTAIRRRLNERLDAAVPEFGEARGASFRLFQAEDAYDFGTKFAKGQIPRDAVASEVRRLNPHDRQIVQTAWVKEKMRGMDTVGNSRDLVGRFDSPAFRNEMDVLFGPGELDRFLATVALEKVMQNSKRATANNPAFRDAMVSGVGGGALGALLGFGATGDVSWTSAAGLAGGVLGRQVGPRLAQRANQEMLTSAARILFSPDPAMRQRALRMAEDSTQFRDALFDLGDRIGLLARSGAAVSHSQGNGEAEDRRSTP